MAQVCPTCGALVGEESQHCASCGAELDPFLTIQPPKFHGGGAPPRPHREVAREPAAPPEPEPDPRSRPQPQSEPQPPSEAPPKPPKPKVRRVAPPPAPAPAPPPAPRPVAPPPQHYAAPPITPPTPPPPAYAPPAYAPPPSYVPPPQQAVYPAAPNPAAAPGRFRKRLIEMLGGKADAAAAAGPPPPQPYAMPAPPPQAIENWPPHAVPPSPQYGPPPVAPAAPPPATAFPAPPSGQGPAEDEDDGLTRMMVGANLAKLKIPTHLYTLQILDRSGQWQPWSTIGTSGLKVGRTERSSQFPELNTMATRHLKLSYDGTRLLAEDQGTLNGVFLKISGPVELREGVRFRVGGHLIEFRETAPLPVPAPLRSEDGEEFWCSDLQPLAFLDFIRPDGTMGLRYPISKAEPTILGRGSRPGKPVDVALPNDDWVSGQHAQVRQENGRFLLEDLHSRNGTFLRTESTAPVASGDVLLVGRVLLRVMEAGH